MKKGRSDAELQELGKKAALYCPRCLKRTYDFGFVFGKQKIMAFVTNIEDLIGGKINPELTEEDINKELDQQDDPLEKFKTLMTLHGSPPMTLSSIITPSSYCPECHIVRTYLMSLPILCGECGFPYWQQDPDKFDDPSSTGPCWLCGGKMIGMSMEKYKQKEEQGEFEDINKVAISVNKSFDFKCSHLFVEKISHHKGSVFLAVCRKCKKEIYAIFA